MVKPAPMTLTVPSTLHGVRDAVDAADRWCTARDVPAPIRRRVLTALDEIVSNVVRHGPPSQGFGGTGSGPDAIAVAFGGDGTIVLVSVADSGPPFDPLSLPPPDTAAPLDARRAGGLGIALVRALADEVRYERRDGRNHLSMTWRISS